jgi:predicted RecB family nuclease
MRLNGVGEEFADLLEEAGVDTVKELATRNAENLAVALAECNEKKKCTDRVPSAETVQKWIDEAKTMDPVVTH